VRENPFQAGAQVRRIAVESGRVAGVFGERERPVRVPPRQGGAFARVDEPVRRVGAHDLQQPVAALLTVDLDGDQRLVDQSCEQIGDHVAREGGVGTNRLDGGDVESSRERGEPAEQHLLVRAEQGVAPLQGRCQRLLACRRGVARRSQQTEPGVEPRRDGGRVERAQAPGGELDRQRQPVETETDPGDVARVLFVDGEARHRRSPALDEQLHRFVAERIGGSDPAVRVWNRQRRDPEHDFSGDAQRLPARRDDLQSRCLAQQQRAEPGNGAEDVLAVVEYQQQRPRPDEVDERVGQGLTGQGAHIEGGGDGVGHEPAIGQVGKLHHHGAIDERRLEDAGELESEPGLADTAGARQSQQPRPSEQRPQLGQLPGATDERTDVGWQTAEASRCQLVELGDELTVEPVELVAPGVGPVVVAILRQQLAAVGGQGRAIRAAGPYPPGVGRRPLEAVDVDVGDEAQQLVADLDRLGPEDPPRHVHGLVEVVQRGHRIAVTPQHVDHLLTVEPMARRQGEQLHQFPCLAQAPRPLGDVTALGSGSETTEESHDDGGHTPRLPDRAGPRHCISRWRRSPRSPQLRRLRPARFDRRQRAAVGHPQHPSEPTTGFGDAGFADLGEQPVGDHRVGNLGCGLLGHVERGGEFDRCGRPGALRKQHEPVRRPHPRQPRAARRR